MNDTIYLCYLVVSEDGRGTPRWELNLHHQMDAKQWLRNVEDNPYLSGYIQVVTRDNVEHINWSREL